MRTSRKTRLEGSPRRHQGWASLMLLLLSGARLGLGAPGDLDATFGRGGVVITDVAARESAAALVRQPDGTLLVAGTSYVQETTRVVLARYAPDGRLDATFGKGGTVTTDLGAVEWANALVQQPDGKLIVAGTVIDPARSLSSSLLLRYQPAGRLDPAFGSDGVVTTAVTGNALVLQPDGKLVAAGGASAPDGGDLALARYQTAGCADHDRACREVLEQFVTGFYVEALARTPRAAEVADWVAYLEAEPTVAATSAMIHAVFDGAEYRARPVTPWDHIAALYRAILGRALDPAGLDWWVGVLLDRLNTALPLFLDAPEFQSLVPDCREPSAVTALVTRLYEEALGRTPTPDEVMAWTQYLLATCDLDGAVVAFFNAAEYLRMPRTLADHVTILYHALLAREPAAAEEALWGTYLAGQLALLEDGFIQCAEFQARWQQLFLSSSP